MTATSPPTPAPDYSTAEKPVLLGPRQSPSLSRTLSGGIREHWATLLVIAALSFGVYLLWEVLAPFVAAAALAYCLNPLVTWVHGKAKGKISRVVSAYVVFFSLMAALVSTALLLVPVIQPQLALIERNAPTIVDKINKKVIPWIAEKTPFDVSDQKVIKEKAVDFIQDNAKALPDLASKLLVGSKSVLGFTGFLAVVLFAALLMLPGFEAAKQALKRGVPQKTMQRISPLLAEIDYTLSSFVSGQLKLIACLSLYYTVALSLVGVNGGWALGLLTGILCAVPVVGIVLSAALAFLSATLEIQAPYLPVLVLGVFVVGQLLESLLFTPKIVGDKIGLGLLDVIFALALFGYLFGMAGVLLALPLAASAKVVMAHAFRRYKASGYFLEN